ncbi:hypothetical protein J4714_13145 [Staphylococcus epidermidis]|nr:hypothetical protein [Staphylococcus epidermidis]
MPTIHDFIAELQTESFKNQYADVKVNGSEPVVGFVARCFQAAAAEYAIFSGITVYDFSRRLALRSWICKTSSVTERHLQVSSSPALCIFARQMAVRNYYLPQSAETFIPATGAVQGISPGAHQGAFRS